MLTRSSRRSCSTAIAVALIGFLILGPLLGAGLLLRPDRRPRQQRPADHPRATTSTSASSSRRSPPCRAVWWLLFRSTLGFEIRSRRREPERGSLRRDATGVPDHAHHDPVGPHVRDRRSHSRSSGVSHFMTPSYGTSIGFDADRGRPARAVAPVRDRRGRPTVRRASGGRRPDADRGRHPGRSSSTSSRRSSSCSSLLMSSSGTCSAIRAAGGIADIETRHQLLRRRAT